MLLRRFVVLLLAGMLGSSFLVGCGGKKQQEQPQMQQSAPATEQAPAATDTTAKPDTTAKHDTTGGK